MQIAIVLYPGATALMARDIAKPAQLKAATLLLWERALHTARSR
ncbi:MAG: hypothetical protein ACRDTV_19475 [Mycobacterium sp.]